jgi:phosphohistidine phosphatase
VAAIETQRTLVLVRHAKSDYPFGVPDHDRPLNARGRRDAPFIGSWIRENVAWPSDGPPTILVSTALRAQLTWGLARNGLGERWQACAWQDDARIYAASARTLRGIIAELPDAVGTAVLVGHNPGLLDVVDGICAESANAREALRKFPTSAVAVLLTDQPWTSALAADRAFEVAAFAVPRA